MKHHTWAAGRYAPAKLSNYIHSITELKPGTTVVLYGRESSRGQKLPPQMTNLQNAVESLGLRVVGVFSEIVEGWREMYDDERGRPELFRAVCKAVAADAVLVAEAANRFRRGFIPRWKPGRPQRQLWVYEVERLLTETHGAPLATLAHPDAPPDEVHGIQTKRGQAGSGNFGGRPKEKFPKKARRQALKSEALELRWSGLSYRAIGMRLGMPWSTIRDWTKHIKNPHTTCARLDNDEMLE